MLRELCTFHLLYKFITVLASCNNVPISTVSWDYDKEPTLVRLESTKDTRMFAMLELFEAAATVAGLLSQIDCSVDSLRKLRSKLKRMLVARP